MASRSLSLLCMALGGAALLLRLRWYRLAGWDRSIPWEIAVAQAVPFFVLGALIGTRYFRERLGATAAGIGGAALASSWLWMFGPLFWDSTLSRGESRAGAVSDGFFRTFGYSSLVGVLVLAALFWSATRNARPDQRSVREMRAAVRR